MQNRILLAVQGAALLGVTVTASAGGTTDEIDAIRQQIEQIRQDYETRLRELEQRLEQAELARQEPAVPLPVDRTARSSAFNPAISLILDGRYNHFSRDPADYVLSGFPLGGEAGPGEPGFALGHNELVVSANVDDKFYGKFTTALAEHDGETEVEIEEAYLEALGLGGGLGLRAGRFYSGIGYLNAQHAHQWDFSDAPLIYRGLFGDQVRDDGLQLTWLAPTDQYLSFGGEILRGDNYPLIGEGGNSPDAWSLFAKTGGDIGISHSWQAGLSWLHGDIAGREAGSGHDHDDADHADEAHPAPAFYGDSDVYGLDFVWKWAPDGNRRQRNLQLQFEYYRRDESGYLVSGDEDGSYDGRQSGWYAQAVYQFLPQWRVGARYDWLTSSVSGSSAELIDEAGLDSGGHDPRRFSLMTDWSNSEFSRIRLQYERDESGPESFDLWTVQYLLSLGAHGAHDY